MKQAFEKGEFPREMNESLISLIPETDSPECMSYFRPIALFNIVTKLISKVIANRVKPLMQRLTSKNQTSFILGRITSDNIVILQEMDHSMKQKSGCKEAVAVKIKLQKTYDRINRISYSLCLKKLVSFLNLLN